MNYDFRHVRYFMAVADELHFRRAAESLNVAQPSLSRAIKQLEEILGVELFFRNNRKVRLTEAGKVFLEGCEQVVGLMQDTEERAQKAALGAVGHLNIGFTDFAISGCLPEIIDGFSREYPEVSLDIRHQFTEQQILEIRSGQIDFGFMTGPVVEEGIASTPVQSNTFVVVLPERHPLADLEEVSLEMLAHERFVMGDMKWWRHYRRHVTRLCNKAKIAPQIVQEAYNTESILGFVAANMGVSIHLDCLENYYRKGVVVRPLKDVKDLLVTELSWLESEETMIKNKFINFVLDHTSKREMAL